MRRLAHSYDRPAALSRPNDHVCCASFAQRRQGQGGRAASQRGVSVVNDVNGPLERAQMCRWLHDGPLQVLNYIAAGGYADVPAEQLRAVAAEAAERMRAFLDADTASDGETLVASLDEAVTDAQLLAPGLDVRLIVGPLEREPDAEAVRELAAATREALTNVRRHSSARHATVRCEVRGGRVMVRVADDGTGFTPQPGSAGRGI